MSSVLQPIPFQIEEVDEGTQVSLRNTDVGGVHIESLQIQLEKDRSLTPNKNHRKSHLKQLKIRIEPSHWQKHFNHVCRELPYLSELWLHPDWWLSGHFKLGKYETDFAFKLVPSVGLGGKITIRLEDAGMFGWVPLTPYALAAKTLRGIFGQALIFDEGVWHFELGPTLLKSLLVANGWRLPAGAHIQELRMLQHASDIEAIVLSLQQQTETLNPKDTTEIESSLQKENPEFSEDPALSENSITTSKTAIASNTSEVTEAPPSEMPQTSTETSLDITKLLTEHRLEEIADALAHVDAEHLESKALFQLAWATLANQTELTTSLWETLRTRDPSMYDMFQAWNASRLQQQDQRIAALQAFQSESDILNALAHLHLGKCLSQQNPSAAIGAWKETLTLGLPRPSLSKTVVRGLIQQKAYPSALYFAEQSRRFGDDPTILRLLAKLYRRQSDLLRATECIDTLIRDHKHALGLEDLKEWLEIQWHQSRDVSVSALKEWINHRSELNPTAAFSDSHHAFEQETIENPIQWADPEELYIKLADFCDTHQQAPLARELAQCGLEALNADLESPHPEKNTLELTARCILGTHVPNASQAQAQHAWTTLARDPAGFASLRLPHQSWLLKYASEAPVNMSWEAWTRALIRTRYAPSLIDSIQDVLSQTNQWQSLVSLLRHAFDHGGHIPHLLRAATIASHHLNQSEQATDWLWEALQSTHQPDLLLAWAEQSAFYNTAFPHRWRQVLKRFGENTILQCVERLAESISEDHIEFPTLCALRASYLGSREDFLLDLHHNLEREPEHCLDRWVAAMAAKPQNPSDADAILSRWIAALQQPTHKSLQPFFFDAIQPYWLRFGPVSRVRIGDLGWRLGGARMMTRLLQTWIHHSASNQNKETSADLETDLSSQESTTTDGWMRQHAPAALAAEWGHWLQTWCATQPVEPDYAHRWLEEAKRCSASGASDTAAEIYRVLTRSQQQDWVQAASQWLELGGQHQVPEWVNAPLDALVSGIRKRTIDQPETLQTVLSALWQHRDPRLASITHDIADQLPGLPSIRLMKGWLALHQASFMEAIATWSSLKGRDLAPQQWGHLLSQIIDLLHAAQSIPFTDTTQQSLKQIGDEFSKHLVHVAEQHRFPSWDLLQNRSEDWVEQFWEQIIINTKSQSRSEWEDTLHALREQKHDASADFILTRLEDDANQNWLKQKIESWRRLPPEQAQDATADILQEIATQQSSNAAKQWLLEQQEHLKNQDYYWASLAKLATSPQERITFLESWLTHSQHHESKVDIYRTLATVQLELGNGTEALETLVDALSEFPDHPRLLPQAFALAAKVKSQNLHQRLLAGLQSDDAIRGALTHRTGLELDAPTVDRLLKRIQDPSQQEHKQHLHLGLEQADWERVRHAAVAIPIELWSPSELMTLASLEPSVTEGTPISPQWWQRVFCEHPSRQQILQGLSAKALEAFPSSVFLGLPTSLLQSIHLPAEAKQAFMTERLDTIEHPIQKLQECLLAHQEERALQHVMQWGVPKLLEQIDASDSRESASVEQQLWTLLKPHPPLFAELLIHGTSFHEEERAAASQEIAPWLEDVELLLSLSQRIAGHLKGAHDALRSQIVHLFYQTQDWEGLSKFLEQAESNRNDWSPVLRRLLSKLSGQEPHLPNSLRVQLTDAWIEEADRVDTAPERATHLRNAAKIYIRWLHDDLYAAELLQRAQALRPLNLSLDFKYEWERLNTFSESFQEHTEAYQDLWTTLRLIDLSDAHTLQTLILSYRCAWLWDDMQVSANDPTPTVIELRQKWLGAIESYTQSNIEHFSEDVARSLHECAHTPQISDSDQRIRLLKLAAIVSPNAWQELVAQCEPNHQWAILMEVQRLRGEYNEELRPQAWSYAARTALEHFGDLSVAWQYVSPIIEHVDTALLWTLWRGGEGAEREMRRRALWRTLVNRSLPAQNEAELIRWCLVHQEDPSAQQKSLQRLVDLAVDTPLERWNLAQIVLPEDPQAATRLILSAPYEWPAEKWLQATQWLIDAGDEVNAKRFIQKVEPTPETTRQASLIRWKLDIDKTANAYRFLISSGSVQDLEASLADNILLDAATLALETGRDDFAEQWLRAVRPDQAYEERRLELMELLFRSQSNAQGLLETAAQKLEKQSFSTQQELYYEALHVALEHDDAQAQNLLQRGIEQLPVSDIASYVALHDSGKYWWPMVFDAWRKEASASERSLRVNWYQRSIREALQTNDGERACRLFEEFPEPQKLGPILLQLSDELHGHDNHPAYPLVEEEALDYMQATQQRDDAWMHRMMRLADRLGQEQSIDELCRLLMRIQHVDVTDAQRQDFTTHLAQYPETYATIFPILHKLAPRRAQDTELLRLCARLAGQLNNHDLAYRYYGVLLDRLPDDEEASRFIAACREARAQVPIRQPRPAERLGWLGRSEDGDVEQIAAFMVPISRFVATTFGPQQRGALALSDKTQLAIHDRIVDRIAPLTRVFALIDPQIHISEHLESATELFLEPEPTLVLHPDFSQASEGQQRAAFLPWLDAFSAGTLNALSLSTLDLIRLVRTVAAAIATLGDDSEQAEHHWDDAFELNEVEQKLSQEIQRQFAQALPAETQASMHRLAIALLELKDLDQAIGGWRSSAFQQAWRAPLIYGADFNELLAIDEAFLLCTTKELMIEYWLSDAVTEARQVLGLSLQ